MAIVDFKPVQFEPLLVLQASLVGKIASLLSTEVYIV